MRLLRLPPLILFLLSQSGARLQRAGDPVPSRGDSNRRYLAFIADPPEKVTGKARP